MSQEDLIDAYQSGRIGRRAFVRGLVRTGLTLTAATGFASVLAACSDVTGVQRVAASQHDFYDFYNFYS
jgi:hypothetical protein